VPDGSHRESMGLMRVRKPCALVHQAAKAIGYEEVVALQQLLLRQAVNDHDDDKLGCRDSACDIRALSLRKRSTKTEPADDDRGKQRELFVKFHDVVLHCGISA